MNTSQTGQRRLSQRREIAVLKMSGQRPIIEPGCRLAQVAEVRCRLARCGLCYTQQNPSFDFVASAGRLELTPRILPAAALLIVGSSDRRIKRLLSFPTETALPRKVHAPNESREGHVLVKWYLNSNF